MNTMELGTVQFLKDRRKPNCAATPTSISEPELSWGIAPLVNHNTNFVAVLLYIHSYILCNSSFLTLPFSIPYSTFISFHP